MSNAQLTLSRKGFAAHPSMMQPFKDPKSGQVYVFNENKTRKIPLNVSPLVANATLTYDEWRLIDDVLLDISRQRIAGIDELREYGLIKPLANPLANTILTYSRKSDSMEANISISPSRRSPGDRPVYENVHFPLPIVHADFDIEDRVLQQSQNVGQGLDEEAIYDAGYAVMLKQVDMLFGASSSFAYDNGTIYTYQTEPNRTQGTLINAWDSSANASGASILADVLAMKQALIDDYYYGPYVVYIPTEYETVLDDDFDTTTATGRTIRERILQVDKIEKIVVVDRLTAGQVIMVSMNRNVVDLVDGFGLTTVEWQPDPFNHSYKVMSMQLPRVKSDYSDRSGIAHWSE